MWCGLGTHYNEKHRGRPTPAATHSPPAQKNKEQRATQIHTGEQEQTDTPTNTNCKHIHSHIAVVRCDAIPMSQRSNAFTHTVPHPP